MEILKSIFSVLFILYIAAGALLYTFQRNFLYFPTDNVQHDYNVRNITVDNETLEILVLNEGNIDAIIYFGGNGESVVSNAPSFEIMFPHYTVYLMNYRGYGGSTGSPTENNIYSDAQLLYDTVSPKHQQISTIGRSLGSGVATFLASTRDIEKMVLITPYNSIENIAQDSYPIFPVSFLLKDKYDSASRVKNIDSTTLIILAEQDSVVPVKYSRLLIEEFPPSQITIATIKGAGHNNLSDTNEYFQLLQKFL